MAAIHTSNCGRRSRSSDISPHFSKCSAVLVHKAALLLFARQVECHKDRPTPVPFNECAHPIREIRSNGRLDVVCFLQHRSVLMHRNGSVPFGVFQDAEFESPVKTFDGLSPFAEQLSRSLTIYLYIIVYWSNIFVAARQFRQSRSKALG